MSSFSEKAKKCPSANKFTYPNHCACKNPSIKLLLFAYCFLLDYCSHRVYGSLNHTSKRGYTATSHHMRGATRNLDTRTNHHSEQLQLLIPFIPSYHRNLVLSNIMTDDNIQSAAYLWVTDSPAALAAYSDISSWDTSRVFDFSWLFVGKRSFNGDLSRWNTSRVTSITGMFSGAHTFNGDLSQWDTSQVTSMTRMFSEAYTFNGDLSQWDTSQVTSMSMMLSNAYAFNSDISRWNTSHVFSMNAMFFFFFIR